ncbi:dTDP-4-dehydrorhamnose reductase [Rhodanobacter sp. BL-MT-08]
MRILLLGGNGQLGRRFIDHGGLAARGELWPASRDGTLIDGGHAEMGDLSAPNALAALLDRVQPQIIVNTAAYTAVDRAEQEQELADRVNGHAVGELGQWAAAHSARVIHYSTDYVFDGRQSQPYDVNANTAPLGAYGRSKQLGERLLRESGADHMIFRTAWVYAAHGQNFLRTMLRLGSERDELRVVSDQHGSPTDTSLIVNGSLAALDRWLSDDSRDHGGIYHLVASGETTWHGFAEAIFDSAVSLGLLARRPTVRPIPSTEFPTPAARPAWSLLDNRDFRERFDFNLPDWRQGLQEVMSTLATSSA